MRTGTATILFTDLVGSTETASRLGPADAERLRRIHDSLVSDAIAGHRGTTVKGLGDGFMARFDAASDAVAAAVAIQQSAHRQSLRSPDTPICVRIGISAGDVTFEDDDCFGAPVVEAARLCAAAQGGHILAADLIRVLARGRAGDRFVAAGSLQLKGLVEPVDAVEVVWETPAESRTPLPPRMGGVATFVGRGLELDTLHSAFKLASSGEGRQVVLIAGEPGMGKTVLTGRAVRDWHDQGASVGAGYCDEDLTMPYQPVSEALTHLVRYAPLHVLASHTGRHGDAVRPLAPVVGDRVPLPPSRTGGDQESERYLAFAAAADLLGAIGDDSPVVLVLEDLHWADAGTLALLRHLATATRTARLLIVGTFRDSELTRSHPLTTVLAALRRLEGVTRVTLAGLTDVEVAAFMSGRAGHELDEPGQALARQLTRETDGNPFYVSELLRHLAETGQIRRTDAGTWEAARSSVRMDLPDSVREVIGSRVGRLGDQAAEVLTAAAVIGNEFDVTLLCRTAELDEDTVLDVLDRARAAALVRELPDAVGRFAFAHALVQHTLVQEAGATRCTLLHRRVAVALEALAGPGGASRQAELAHHWGEASRTSDAARARDYAMKAAEHAVDALAPDEAARWYERALELHSHSPESDDATTADIQTALGAAQQQAGAPDYRATLLKAARLARRLGDAPRLTAAVLASNRGTFSAYGRVDAEKVELLEVALATVGDDAARRCRLLATLANELTYGGDYPRRRAIADEAVELARTVDDPGVLLRVLNLVFHPIWVPDSLGERLALSGESVELAQQVGDPLMLFWSEHRHFINLMQSGRIDEADHFLSGEWDFAERLGQPLLRWSARYSAAGRSLFAGEPEEAEDLARQALEFGRDSSQPEAAAYYVGQLMGVRWQQGRESSGIGVNTTVADNPGAPSLEAGLALALADAGRYSDAGAILQRAASVSFSHMPRDPSYMTGMTCFAEVAIRLGDSSCAGLLYDALRPWSDQVGFDAVTTVGPVSHFVAGLAALVGRDSEAESLFRQTAARAEGCRAPFFLARTLYEWGRLLLGRGGAGDALEGRGLLTTARQVAGDHGYEAVMRRCAALLDGQ
ncbi:MAG TPA: AAA family ATPase [Acidimicrobiales bacterium]|nr:AAA family ATPase [Acidimicrobiales bacterium]